MSKKILIYGAGAIGRGYIPWVFSPYEYEYYYVENNDSIHNLLNSKKEFTTYKTKGDQYENMKVPVKHCFKNGEEKDFLKEVDVIVTSVGPRNLLSLAENLHNISTPILCCENDSFLPKVLSTLTNNPNVVFAIPDVITSNVATDEFKKNDPLSIITEDGVCYIDKKVSHVGGDCIYVDEEELKKQWQAKLYLHNTPHCIAAYLGSLLGVQYVHEVMNNKNAQEIVANAMKEMQEVLLKTFNLDEKFVNWYAEKELKRFSNMLLYDPVTRVAREPFRKLALGERLIGAAELALGSGIIPENIIKGIMAAFYYNNPRDPDANISYLINALEPTDFLRIAMKLDDKSALHKLILDRWSDNIRILKNLK